MDSRWWTIAGLTGRQSKERERERGGKKKDEKKEEKMFLFFWPPTAGPCERYSVEKQTKPG